MSKFWKGRNGRQKRCDTGLGEAEEFRRPEPRGMGLGKPQKGFKAATKMPLHEGHMSF